MVGRLPSFWEGPFSGATVDGKNPAPLGMPQKVLIVRKTNILGILNGAGFVPSTVC